MTKEDIIRMAREAGFVVDEDSKQHQPKCIGFTHYLIDDELERFAALSYAAGAAAEREAIMDEWWMCVQSDLENGVKSLNERATEKLHKEYPAIAGFDAAIRARKN